MSDSLWSHGLQHARLPCPSPVTGACSNSGPLSRWCHPTVSSSVNPLCSCIQSFSTSGSFPMTISVPYSQSYGFSSSHIWMWELDYKESWVLKNLCFWPMVWERTLESPLDCKEIQPVHPKGDQPWIFIGRTDAEAETLILCAPGVKNWLPGKDSDTEKDWRQKEKGTTEDEMIGWHHRLNGPEFEQAPGDREAQGSLACCSPRGCKELAMT